MSNTKQRKKGRREKAHMTYKLQAETISKKLELLKGIFFSLINSAKTSTLAGWPPLLKALIRDEHAIESGWTSSVSISKNSAEAFSQFSATQRSLGL